MVEASYLIHTFDKKCLTLLILNFSHDIFAGAFGKVFEASLRSMEDGSSRTVAIKTIKGSNTNIRLMKGIGHDFAW